MLDKRPRTHFDFPSHPSAGDNQIHLLQSPVDDDSLRAIARDAIHRFVRTQQRVQLLARNSVVVEFGIT
jgi:hypothetical protein